MFREHGTELWKCKRVKLVYVTPRYGTEVIGGAESGARMIAERVASQLGWDVEVLTSCALQSSTWENEYPVGEVEIGGVKVRRFATEFPRSSEFNHTSFLCHNNPKLAPLELQERWVDEQGPYAPELLDAIADSDADVVAFYPYLYYPTIRGLQRVKNSAVSVMHPAAHDEASIKMSIFAETFGAADAFVWHTDGERRIVEDLFSIADRPQILLGLGVEAGDGDPQAFRAKFGIGDAPYVLCLGRMDKGKGSHSLVEYFAEYKKRHPSPLKLVFVGPVIQPLDEESDDVIVAGLVSPEEKWGALRGCQVLISPSPFESFSLVLLEAWMAEKPVLVNKHCVATVEHVSRSKGGLWFGGYADFDVSLEKLLSADALASAMAQAGKAYVEENFAWPSLIARYGSFLEALVQRKNASQKRSAKDGQVVDQMNDQANDQTNDQVKGTRS